jgi:hypothetical protein
VIGPVLTARAELLSLQRICPRLMAQWEPLWQAPIQVSMQTPMMLAFNDIRVVAQCAAWVAGLNPCSTNHSRFSVSLRVSKPGRKLRILL